MKTLTIRDFRSRPREARSSLASETETLLTANGKPVALMLPVDAESLEETLDVLRRARAIRALAAIRQRAKAGERDKISMHEIDAEIQDVRARRRDHAKKTGRE